MFKTIFFYWFAGSFMNQYCTEKLWFSLSWNSWESLILCFGACKIYEGKENFSYLCGVAKVLMNLEADLIITFSSGSGLKIEGFSTFDIVFNYPCVSTWRKITSYHLQFSFSELGYVYSFSVLGACVTHVREYHKVNVL